MNKLEEFLQQGFEVKSASAVLTAEKGMIHYIYLQKQSRFEIAVIQADGSVETFGFRPV